jgi:hypothetical protein
MNYTVTSDNFAPGKKGQVLTEKELGTCNIAALVAAGHLAEKPEPPAKTYDKEQN